MNESAANFDDADLLRRYAADHDEAAFAELVRRHVGFVYGAAQRRVGGDSQLAEDVTQQVFVALARGATSLARRPVLAGWLFTTTRFAAAQIVRSERRRRARETEVHLMEITSTDATVVADWEQLRPALDDALDALNERDREAVLLRFFAGNAYAEIGTKLSLSENSARMRVDRALVKLQAAFARRGIKSTSAALATVLANQALATAPAGLAGAATSAALASSLGAGALVTTLSFMTMTKLQVGVTAALLVAGATGFVWQHRTNTRLETEIARSRAQETEVVRLREENRRLNAATAKTTALRAEPTDVVKTHRNEEASTARTTPPRKGADTTSSGPPLAPGLVAVETLGNGGRATPRAAFATQLWAARTGDIDLEAAALSFNAAARARLEALLATLPENIRAQYGTPERLMAFLLAGSPHPVGGMQVVGEDAQGDDDTILHTEWQHADDAIVHRSDVHFHREPDGWRWIVPSTLVNRAAAYAGQLQAAPPAGGG